MKEKISFLIYVLCIIVVAEFIGVKSFAVGSFHVSILPLVFAVLLTMILGTKLFRRGLLQKIYTTGNIEFAGTNMIFIMLPLMARYGADVAPKLNEIFQLGWVFILQAIGNIGTVLLGLPIALLLGLKRESIGATLGIGREGELAYISEKFSLNSPEGRGVLSIYLVGTLFGSIIFSFIPPVINILGFDYRALAIGTGLGSASMMTAASSSLIPLYPNHAETIFSYAAASQLITSFMGTYIMVFLSIPLMNVIFNLLTKENAINIPLGGVNNE